MPFCEICHEFKFTETHKCPPKWNTNIVEYDDDSGLDVHARTAELAAIKRAKEHDVGDYDLLQGGDITILVRSANGVVEKFNCTGEAVPEYRAKKIP